MKKNKEMNIKKKKKGKNADISIRELWNADKDLNLNGIPELKDSKTEEEAIFKKIISNNFPEL